MPDPIGVAGPSGAVGPALPLVSTALSLPTAPWTGPADRDGTVVHPRRPVVVRSAPGGPGLAVLPVTALGSPTWVPVVSRRPGWLQVLLPSRPNGSAGWIADGGPDQLDLARSLAVVRVDVAAARMSISTAGQPTRSWPVVVGAPATPTPRGTTFLMASVDDPGNPYSRYLLPLGWHSDTLDSFGGGPGTVALHGWRDTGIFALRGRALSHGCIRIPADALARARALPLGTPVVIT